MPQDKHDHQADNRVRLASRARVLAFSWLACMLLAAHAEGATTIRLRDGLSPVEAERVTFSDAGVGFATPSERGLVGWDRVLNISGDSAEEAAPWSDLADHAFRARVRLQRGDWQGAEPLLEDLARQLQEEADAKGPTAAVVFEGLVHCRVERRAYAAAVLPWIEWTRVQDRHAKDDLLQATTGGTTSRTIHSEWVGGQIAPTSMAPAVIDAATSLCPSLPPIWLEDAGVRSAADSTEWDRVTGPVDETIRSSAKLAAWYRVSMRLACGVDTPLPISGENSTPGVRLVADIVTARFGDTDARTAARSSLTQHLEAGAKDAKTPRWLEAWCRAGLGNSLVREESVDERRRGVVQLLHVPARFGNEQPYLAGVCLAQAAATLKAMGDESGADALKRELARRYPGHAALGWQGLSGVGGPENTTAHEHAAKGGS